MAIFTGIEGVVKEVKSLYTSVEGVVREIKEEFCGVDGVIKQLFCSEKVVFEMPPFTVSNWKINNLLSDELKNSSTSLGAQYSTNQARTTTGNTWWDGWVYLNSLADYAGKTIEVTYTLTQGKYESEVALGFYLAKQIITTNNYEIPSARIVIDERLVNESGTFTARATIPSGYIGFCFGIRCPSKASTYAKGCYEGLSFALTSLRIIE